MAGLASGRREPKFGVLLPHFGRHASRAAILGGGRQIEENGFDSVWVRDHVVYRPHAYEDESRAFVEPFITLTAVASVTTHVELGTAVLVPHRHPIVAAHLLASLALIAGDRRIIAGWGRGHYDQEFHDVGVTTRRRGALLVEQVDAIRRLLDGDPVTFEGSIYKFANVQVARSGSRLPIPFWHGGNGEATVRRAAQAFDGWMGSQIPLRYFGERVALLERVSDEFERPHPDVAVVCLASPARTVEEGARAFDIPRLCDMSTKLFKRPAGECHSLKDLEGAVIAGPPAVLAETVNRYISSGATQIVFDLRDRFDDWEDVLQAVGEEVLPLLRATQN